MTKIAPKPTLPTAKKPKTNRIRRTPDGKLRSDGRGRDSALSFKSDELRFPDVKKSLDSAQEMLLMNHEAIEQLSWILNKSQPPMSGKIEVRWWHPGGSKNSRGVDKGPQPTMVQWRKEGLPEPIPPTDLIRRANKRAGFEKNYKDTCLILSYLTQLFVARKKLLDIISEFNRSTSLFNKLNQIPLLMAHKMGTFTKIEARIDSREMTSSNPYGPHGLG